MDFEDKAQQKWQEGQKKLSKRSIFGRSTRAEEAVELFVSAANLWKSGKNYLRAAEAFELAASLAEKKEDTRRSSSRYWQDAAQSWRRSERPIKAIECMKNYCTVCLEFGKVIETGKMQRQIAEVYEGEGNTEGATNFYRTAIATLTGEERCAVELRNNQLKLAELLSLSGEYEEAITLYETAAFDCLESKLTKWVARNHFMRAFVCMLVLGDVTRAEESLERYKEMDPTLAGTPEATCMEAVVEALTEEDVEKFTAAVYEYNRLKKLDSWMTDMFLKVKERLVAEDSEDSL
eukprot:gnl/Chilomastix_cuspidata/192.p1 GENE.gnl/Chilomastix_cuspidata/192~~gnl/Chilomastix_cuspidata/192.p1  ORF type:complete len:299 (-),score=107.47 gnl/Chilomastix_cuspidata/192:426-1301(-)